MRAEEKQISRIIALISKHLQGGLSAAEAKELEQWVLAADENKSFFDQITDSSYRKEQLQEMGNFTDEEIAWTNFLNKNKGSLTKRNKTLKINRFLKYVAAAAILVVLAVGGYFYNRHIAFNSADEGQYQNLSAKNDIAPGNNKAILTLANGQKISLTDVANGTLVDQAEVSITKTKNGQLVYSSSAKQNKNSAVQYNTTETPRGGQYTLVLFDGTKVILNAASSLKYPTRFNGKQRIVELTGEGYFEVAKDKAHPFVVKTSKQKVEVLGTHFNINAYEDEQSVKTTLLEGSVRVSSKSGLKEQVKILKPGEQSLLVNKKITVSRADIEEATAWKDGKFVFENESIESIMRKLSRWYNIEVVYDGEFKNKVFTGSISRSNSISKILDKITFTQAVHFKIKGRRIVVMQ